MFKYKKCNQLDYNKWNHSFLYLLLLTIVYYSTWSSLFKISHYKKVIKVSRIHSDIRLISVSANTKISNIDKYRIRSEKAVSWQP